MKYKQKEYSGVILPEVHQRKHNILRLNILRLCLTFNFVNLTNKISK